MHIDIHGVHAPGWQTARVASTNFGHGIATGFRNARHDLNGHPSRTRPFDNRIAIDGELGGIEMAVCVDKYKRCHV
jgi:hypothetical protein